MNELKPVSVGVAMVWSFFFPGAGAIYCGRTKRGVLTYVAFLCGIALFVVPSVIVLVWALIDAKQLAEAHNKTVVQNLHGGVLLKSQQV